jgi:hypothetical protein
VLLNIRDNYPDGTTAVQTKVPPAYIVACVSGFKFFEICI